MAKRTDSKLNIVPIPDHTSDGQLDSLGQRLAERLSRHYHTLRRQARALLTHNRDKQLQPTELLDEAMLRLIRWPPKWNNTTHFLAIAIRVMRQVLIDQARRRHNVDQESLSQAEEFADPQADRPFREMEVKEEIKAAFEKLAAVHPKEAMVARLVVMEDMNPCQAAVKLNISETTSLRHWRLARAFLQRELSGNHGS